MAAIDQLNQTKANLLAQLANITANPKPSYSLDGQSVSWQDYQRWLLDSISRVNTLIQIEGGPFFQETQGFSY